MKTLILLVTFLVVATTADYCRARPVRILDMQSLVAGSEIVLVGRITSVRASGITTKLSFHPWRGVTFEWLAVEVEVIEPIKGVNASDTVQTLLLSARGRGPSFNPPGMVDPMNGQLYLMCLLPTTLEDVYASMTAPWDDDQAVFILDRTHWEYSHYREDTKRYETDFPKESERYRTIWSLVDDEGRITPHGAEAMRTKYETEIKAAVPKDRVIHLRWKTHTSESGWQWDVPADQPKKVTETSRTRKTSRRCSSANKEQRQGGLRPSPHWQCESVRFVIINRRFGAARFVDVR